MEQERLLVRVSEAADLMGISRSKAYQLIASRIIPVVRIGPGNSVRVPLEELKAWIKESCENDNAESDKAAVASQSMRVRTGNMAALARQAR